MVTIATEGDNDLSVIRIYYWWLQGRSVLLSASISYLSVLTAPSPIPQFDGIFNTEGFINYLQTIAHGKMLNFDSTSFS